MAALHLSRPWQSPPAGNRFFKESGPPAAPKFVSYGPQCTMAEGMHKCDDSAGAAIGLFAGDALPLVLVLSSVFDCRITHPNVLNAATLYWPMPNVLCVEGHALDWFAEGLWALQPVHWNKVGLVLDAGIEEDLRIHRLQVADATRASFELPVVEYIVTDTPLEVEKWIDCETG